jgi:CBS domain-containing protein
MRVVELMTKPVTVCAERDNLAQAARLMWERDCGFVAVVDAAGALVGTLTDRDICMAAYTQGKRLEEISVGAVAPRGVHHVGESDPLEAAETLMGAHRVRRVPVVDAAGRPVGIVSLSDLARHSIDRAGGRMNGAGADSLAQTLVAISRPLGPGLDLRGAPPRPAMLLRGSGALWTRGAAANDER